MHHGKMAKEKCEWGVYVSFFTPTNGSSDKINIPNYFLTLLASVLPQQTEREHRYTEDKNSDQEIVLL